MAAGHSKCLAATMLAAAACVPPAAKPLDALDRHEQTPERVGALRPGYRESIAVPRPSVPLARYLPEPSEHGRWPLGVGAHPALEPKFDVAAALAEPGVTWTQLCARGAQHRMSPAQHDQLEYLAAWCDAAAHEPDKALGHLANIAHAPVLGLGDAIALDIADIVVDAGNAEQAIHLLQRNHLVTAAQLDLVAAMYFEIGDNDSARAIGGEAAGADAAPRADVRCHRIARAIMLASGAARVVLSYQLAPRPGDQHPDPTCKALYDELVCWAYDPVACRQHLADVGLDEPQLTVAQQYAEWPREPEPWETWFTIASATHRTADGDAMFVAAEEAALAVSHCERPRIHIIAEYAALRLTEPFRDRAFDARLLELAHADEESCARMAVP